MGTPTGRNFKIHPTMKVKKEETGRKNKDIYSDIVRKVDANTFHKN